jgi:hypothetical protein
VKPAASVIKKTATGFPVQAFYSCDDVDHAGDLPDGARFF